MPRPLQLGVAAFVALICLTLVGLDLVDAWQQRSREIDYGRRAGANLARSLGQHAEDTIRTADATIIGLTRRLEIDGGSPENLGQLHDIMAMRIASFPALVGFVVANADGECVATSLPQAASQCRHSGAEYLEYHRTHPGTDPHLGTPVKLAGSWIIPLSRRFDRADGSFAGVVAAEISIKYFQDFYDTFELGRHGAIVLLLADGIVLARRPFVEANIGRSLGNGPLFRDYLPRAPMGTVELTSSADGIVRLTSYRRVGSYPLVISVALAVEDILKPWRTNLRAHLVRTAIVILVIGLLGARLAAQIRQRQRVETAHARTAAAYRLLAENTTDMIMRIGPDSRRLYVSPASRELLGYEPEELLGRPNGELVHPDDRPEWVASFTSSGALLGRELTQAIYRVIRKDGGAVWVEARRRQLPDGDGFVVSVRDISARKRAEERLEQANRRLAALTKEDGLTGLANRRHFDETLDAEFRRAAREATALSLIMLDVDHFKMFNDSYGHPAGDRCLRAIGVSLKGLLRRPADLAARYGGEEFAILLPSTPLAGAVEIAERARAAVRALRIEHACNPDRIVTISLGVATFAQRPDFPDPDDLVAAADRALYAAKASGRDRVCTAASAPAVAPGHVALPQP
ncbi:MAG: diguanylate cyclase [Alphaproteobacteria bacterium]|nr:diguanylate cyclase [Alphaproteobacteria bacterium]